MVPSRTAADVLGGMGHVLDQFGAVPRMWVWDQEACIGRWTQGRQRLTDEFQAFRGGYGVAVKLCAPADPEAKGLVERANGYLETSFLPGRRFDDVADFNRQLTTWLRQRANQRIHVTTKQRPGGSDLRRPRVDARVPTGVARPRPPVQCPSRPGPLRAGRHLRLLDQPSLHRSPHRRARHARRRDCHLRRRRGRPPPPLLGRPPDLDPARARPDRPHHARRADRCRRLPPRLRGATRPHRLRPGRRTVVMASTTPSADVAYLCRALKAPSMAQAVERLAERARADGWTHEEFLAACLEREVAARAANGGELRIRAARLPARKSLDEFDFDHQRSLRRDVVAHLGALDFVAARDNVVFLGPPGTGKTHLAIGLSIRACQAGHRVVFATAAEWSTVSPS